MGIFSKKATTSNLDVELAYQYKQTTGLVLVLGELKSTVMSGYPEHRPTLLKIMDSNQKFADETVTVPVVIRFDTASPYKDSVGVYFGDSILGWVIKDEAVRFVDKLKADGRRGVGILGELYLDRGDTNSQVVFHELMIYA